MPETVTAPESPYTPEVSVPETVEISFVTVAEATVSSAWFMSVRARVRASPEVEIVPSDLVVQARDRAAADVAGDRRRPVPVDGATGEHGERRRGVEGDGGGLGRRALHLTDPDEQGGRAARDDDCGRAAAHHRPRVSAPTRWTSTRSAPVAAPSQVPTAIREGERPAARAGDGVGRRTHPAA